MTDSFQWSDFVLACAGVVTVVTALTLLHRVFLSRLIRETREFFAWWKKFQRDWDGTPEEPGRSAVPGVMERLNAIDGELKRNGGNSLKDQVIKTRERVDHVDRAVQALQAEFTAHTASQRG